MPANQLNCDYFSPIGRLRVNGRPAKRGKLTLSGNSIRLNGAGAGRSPEDAALCACTAFSQARQKF